ncbi:MAG: AAA family ATPase [Vampirovibrionia bacterium]
MNSLIDTLDNECKIHTEVDLKTKNIKVLRTCIEDSFDNFFGKKYENRFKGYNDLDKCNEGFIKPRSKPTINKKKVQINVDINSLGDIIQMTEDYPLYKDVEYDINMEGLHKIKEYLIRLDAFVGLEELKENLLDQLIYFIHEKDDDYLHTVLYGKPGTGKTEIAMLLGKIYTKLGILSKGTFVKATRSDFVAGYLGQTAIKTRKLIEDNLGGVVFIDEAYAMGNEEKRDSFSKEALDTLCELLSHHKSELMVIIAGYKEELDKCFFSYNPGLESRFAWKFEISPYNSEELTQIFNKKLHDACWFLDSKINLESWIEERMNHFKSYGRDVENLFSKCKICHFRRIFGKKDKARVISLEDLENGFKKFTNMDNSSNEKEMKPNFMYT